MPSIANPTFTRGLFATGAERHPGRKIAVEGFSQILTSLVTRELRRSMTTGSTGAVLGMGDSAAGAVYGSLFDQALGKSLAKSSAMKPLNAMLRKEIGRLSALRNTNGPALRPRATARSKPASVQPLASAQPGLTMLKPARLQPPMPTNGRGPRLLPPSPTQSGQAAFLPRPHAPRSTE